MEIQIKCRERELDIKERELDVNERQLTFKEDTNERNFQLLLDSHRNTRDGSMNRQ